MSSPRSIRSARAELLTKPAGSAPDTPTASGTWQTPRTADNGIAAFQKAQQDQLGVSAEVDPLDSPLVDNVADSKEDHLPVRIRDVNLRRLAQRTKDEHLKCFGRSVKRVPLSKFRLRSVHIKVWDVIGALNNTWEDNMCPRIEDVINNNRGTLRSSKSSVAATPCYSLRPYLVGIDKNHAWPYVAIVCGCEDGYFCGELRKLILALEFHKEPEIEWGESVLRIKSTIQKKALEHENSDADSQKQSRGHDIHSVDDPPLSDQLVTLYWNPSLEISSLCGKKIDIPNGSSATLGGAIDVAGKIFGLTVAHLFSTLNEETGKHTPSPGSNSPSDCASNVQEDEESLPEDVLNYLERLAELTEHSMESSDEDWADDDNFDESGLGFDAEVVGEDLEMLDGKGSTVSQLLGNPTKDFLNQEAPDLDWALIDLQPLSDGRLTTVNIIATSSSNDSVGILCCKGTREDKPAQRQALLVAKSGASPVRAKAVSSTSLVSIDEKHPPIRAWTIHVKGINDGDCGSWVLDRQTGDLAGVLFSACPEMDEAYIIPGHQLLKSISQSQGCPVTVSKPASMDDQYFRWADKKLRIRSTGKKSRLQGEVSVIEGPDLVSSFSELLRRKSKLSSSKEPIQSTPFKPFVIKVGFPRDQMSDAAQNSEPEPYEDTLEYGTKLAAMVIAAFDALTVGEGSVDDHQSKYQVSTSPVYPQHQSFAGTAATDDSDFKEQSHPESFFRRGKVFKTMQIEPLPWPSDQSSSPKLEHLNADQVSQKLRCFIVVNKGQNNSTCVPIIEHKTVADAQRSDIGGHNAIAFTGKEAPQQGLLNTLPVIKIEPRIPGERLSELCRIDFQRLDTIKHNVRVYDFGDVHPDHIQKMVELWIHAINSEQFRV